jgi:hypothetical protein
MENKAPPIGKSQINSGLPMLARDSRPVPKLRSIRNHTVAAILLNRLKRQSMPPSGRYTHPRSEVAVTRYPRLSLSLSGAKADKNARDLRRCPRAPPYSQDDLTHGQNPGARSTSLLEKTTKLPNNWRNKRLHHVNRIPSADFVRAHFEYRRMIARFFLLWTTIGIVV